MSSIKLCTKTNRVKWLLNIQHGSSALCFVDLNSGMYEDMLEHSSYLIVYSGMFEDMYAGAFRLFDCLLVITLLVVLENAFAWVATNLFSLAFCFFLLDWLALGRTSRAWSASCFTPWNTRCRCYPVSWFLPTTCTNHTSYNSQGNYTSLVCTPLKSSYFCPVDFPMLKLERYQLHMLSALPIVHWLKKM